jgi:hypothetical protein
MSLSASKVLPDWPLQRTDASGSLRSLVRSPLNASIVGRP